MCYTESWKIITGHATVLVVDIIIEGWGTYEKESISGIAAIGSNVFFGL